MNWVVKGGYFAVGVLFTLLIGWLTAPIWMFRSDRENEHRSNMRKFSGHAVFVVGHGNNPEKDHDPEWKYHEKNKTAGDDIPVLIAEGKWDESHYVMFRTTEDAAKARKLMLEALRNAQGYAPKPQPGPDPGKAP